MISGNKIRLRKKKLTDARNDYAWQTDPELANLDAAPLLTTNFMQYLLDYALTLHASLSTTSSASKQPCVDFTYSTLVRIAAEGAVFTRLATIGKIAAKHSTINI